MEAPAAPSGELSPAAYDRLSLDKKIIYNKKRHRDYMLSFGLDKFMPPQLAGIKKKKQPAKRGKKTAPKAKKAPAVSSRLTRSAAQ